MPRGELDVGMRCWHSMFRVPAGASTALTSSLRELVRSRKRAFSIGEILDRFEDHGGLA